MNDDDATVEVWRSSLRIFCEPSHDLVECDCGVKSSAQDHHSSISNEDVLCFDSLKHSEVLL